MVFFGFVCYGRFHLLYQFPSVIESPLLLANHFLSLYPHFLFDPVQCLFIIFPCFLDFQRVLSVKDSLKLLGYHLKLFSEFSCGFFIKPFTAKKEDFIFLLFSWRDFKIRKFPHAGFHLFFCHAVFLILYETGYGLSCGDDFSLDFK